jgi:hypothetical protein
MNFTYPTTHFNVLSLLLYFSSLTYLSLSVLPLTEQSILLYFFSLTYLSLSVLPLTEQSILLSYFSLQCWVPACISATGDRKAL